MADDTAAPDAAELAAESIGVARRWVQEGIAAPDAQTEDPAVIADRAWRSTFSEPGVAEFGLELIARVAAPADDSAAGRALRNVGTKAPEGTGRGWFRILAAVGPLLPGPSRAAALAWLERKSAHLWSDARHGPVAAALEALPADRTITVQPLFPPSVTPAALATNLATLLSVLESPVRFDVTLRPAELFAVRPGVDLDRRVAEAAAALVPLLRASVDAQPARTIAFEFQTFAELDFTVALFQSVFGTEDLRAARAALVFPCYFPGARWVFSEFQEWATTRRAKGGPAVTIVLGRGAESAAEAAQAAAVGQPSAVLTEPREIDAQFALVLDAALRPESVSSVAVCVAVDDPYLIAYAKRVAETRGVTASLTIERPFGERPDVTETLRADFPDLSERIPLLLPGASAHRFATVKRRLAQYVAGGDAVDAVRRDSHAPGAGEVPDAEDSARRFEDAITLAAAIAGGAEDTLAVPRRSQSRATSEAGQASIQELPTDYALAVNRRWAADIIARAHESTLGVDEAATALLADHEPLEQALETLADNGLLWGQEPPAARASMLGRVADALHTRRAELIEVALAEAIEHEGGLSPELLANTLEKLDDEVTQAIGAVRSLARLAMESLSIDAATPVPPGLFLVVPDWRLPLLGTIEAVAAGLAAGGAVLVMPAEETSRTAAVVTEVLWKAGADRALLAQLRPADHTLWRIMVEHPRVAQVLALAGPTLADQLRASRADLPTQVETPSINAAIITGSVSLADAIADVRRAADGPSFAAIGTIVVTGPRRFRQRAVDALSGIAGVDGTPLTVVEAATVTQAVQLAEAEGFLKTSTLYSLDPAEQEEWRGVTGAGYLFLGAAYRTVPAGVPLGGFGAGVFGQTALPGGPNRLLSLTDWESLPHEAGTSIALTGLSPAVTTVIGSATSELSWDAFDWVRRAAKNDEADWHSQFAEPRDLSVGPQQTITLRYRTVPVVVRFGSGGTLAELLRVLSAALLATEGQPSGLVTVSVAEPLSIPLAEALALTGVEVTVEDIASWHARVAGGQIRGTRIRLLGDEPVGAVRAAVQYATTAGGSELDAPVFDGSVTVSGRLELLAFLQEQVEIADGGSARD